MHFVTTGIVAGSDFACIDLIAEVFAPSCNFGSVIGKSERGLRVDDFIVMLRKEVISGGIKATIVIIGQVQPELAGEKWHRVIRCDVQRELGSVRQIVT